MKRQKKLTLLVDEDVATLVHEVTVALTGEPAWMTKARFATEALRRYAVYLQERWNDGKPFPATSKRLVGGRPLKRG